MLLKDKDKTPVWLFSDSPNDARNFIPEKYQDRITLVDEFLDEPATTLTMMRHGSGFVIANSTFSWWAAQIRHDSSAVVCFPHPWFEALAQPQNLIPDSWVPIHRATKNSAL